jgi:hypothetical protein
MAQETTKDDLGKELMQCMAFAHFAVMKYNTPKKDAHKQAFYDLFDSDNPPNTSVIKKYKVHLGKKFDFARIFGNWKHTYTDTGILSINPTTKIVYDVAKTFYESGLIGKNFTRYEFLDQSDAFVEIVKNKSLNRIAKALNLPYKIDILSSADMYIVKKNSIKKTIVQTFMNKIIKKSDIHLINNFTDYNDILLKFWKSKDLFGISLKLPSAIGGAKNIKIVGILENKLSKSMAAIVDPYTKFISLLTDENTNVRKVIEDTIQFGKFELTEAAWKFPVTFKYQQLGLYGSDVKFNLMAWPKAQKDGGGSAGFNGAFDKSNIGYSSQWVGGTGIKAMETFFFQYPEYNKIANEVASIRKKALNYVITGNANKSPNFSQTINAEVTIPKPAGSGKRAVTRKLKTKGKNKDTITPYNKEGVYSRMQYLKGRQGNYDYGKSPTKDTQTYKMIVRKLQSLYSSVVREITGQNLFIGSTRQEKLIEFFNQYDNTTGESNTFLKYKKAVINLAKGRSISYRGENLSDSMVNTFYEHSQLSYFLLRGGKDFEKYLKQRIFLTVFGVITKKSYKIISEEIEKNPQGVFKSSRVIGAIRANVSKGLIQNIKEFDTVPHFYFS